MVTGTLAFLFGIAAFQRLHFLPESSWGGLLALLIAAATLAWWRWADRPPWRRCSTVILLLLLGFGWAWLRASWALTNSLLAQWEGRDVVVVGTIAGLPEPQERRLRFQFHIESAHLNDEVLPFDGHVLLSWYENAPSLLPGERWQFTVRLKRPRGMANPGSFDYEAWLYANGIGATGYVRTHPAPELLGLASGPQARIDRARAELRGRIGHALGEEAAFAPIVQALTLGDKSAMSRDQWQVLTATGTNHLMAISGLHVGMIAALAWWLAAQAWRWWAGGIVRLPVAKAGAIAGFAAALVYAFLAGFSIPTQRALAMIAVLCIAIVSDRGLRPMAVLAAALWCVLLLDPLAVLSPGFWLSFGAVTVILYGMGHRLGQGGAWWRWGRVQVVVGIGLIPVLIGFFGTAPPLAPIANLLAVPWVSLLVVPAALVGTLLTAVSPWLGTPFLLLAHGLLEWLWPSLELLAAQPIPHWPAPPWWVLAASLVGVGWLLAPRAWPARPAGLLWLMPLVLWQPERPAPGEAWLTLLDVGQGLATVVETTDHLLVYDAGPRFGPEFDTGAAVVEPFLRYRGRPRIDVLVISHGDNDHIGGARSLTDGWPIGRLLTGVPEKIHWTAREPCRRGQSWEWDGVRFEILHPMRAGQGNDGSCVLRVETQGGAFLLTGDIEARAEGELIASGANLCARVLVVPHHGSKTSSTRPFIEAVAPELALVPVGYRNRYRLPNGDVMARYDTAAVWTAGSDTEGAITVRLGPDRALQLESHREQARRYYHTR